jgi:hypothetical protein
MIDARTQALLQDIVRRAGRSMLQYVGESYPWVGNGEETFLAKLREVVDDEERYTEDLVRFLRRSHVPLPYLGSYAEWFTNLNYLSLDYLLPKLVDYQKQAIAVLERDLGLVTQPKVKAELEKLLSANRRHLEALEQMAASHTNAAVK